MTAATAGPASGSGRRRLAAAALACLLLAGCGGSPKPVAVHAVAYKRTIIYHSPATPGYTSWVGAWEMPDGSLMTAFTQATGPTDPRKRPLMPAAVLQRAFRLTESPAAAATAHASYKYLDPRFDFYGLKQSVVYLRSTDRGATWKRWREDPFRALSPQAYSPQPTLALRDGTLIRRVSGVDLRDDPSIRHRALLATLPFDPSDSSGQAAQWSAPRAPVRDPSVCADQISRIRRLRDGRVVALGSVVGFAHGTSGACKPDSQGFSLLLLVARSEAAARDGQWSLGMPFTDAVRPNEWDVAELPDGDLLAVMRTQEGRQPVRMQAILRQAGHTWRMEPPRRMPGLPAFQPSGHPELLSTWQGAIISFASTGAAYTPDGGRHWTTLAFRRPARDYRTGYYPRSVQARDGTIYVFSHRGADDPYGAVDQAIIMDRFRLVNDKK